MNTSSIVITVTSAGASSHFFAELRRSKFENTTTYESAYLNLSLTMLCSHWPESTETCNEASDNIKHVIAKNR